MEISEGEHRAFWGPWHEESGFVVKFVCDKCAQIIIENDLGELVNVDPPTE